MPDTPHDLWRSEGVCLNDEVHALTKNDYVGVGVLDDPKACILWHPRLSENERGYIIMKGDNRTGKLGERYAAGYLSEHGYEILYTNYRTPYAEIDIIAREITTDTLCFIEVKTRQNKLYGRGADFIFPSKKHKLILGARGYIASHNVSNDIRFDVIEVYGYIVTGGFKVDELNHIKNAFDAN